MIGDPSADLVAPTGLHREFLDAASRCTYVDASGARCVEVPVKGSPTSSSCEAHLPQPVEALPSIPLTAEESISAPTLDAPAGPAPRPSS